MRSARAWEEAPVATKAEGETSGAAGFDVVQGRGRALHSKLQDARKGQLNLHAFQMKTQVDIWDDSLVGPLNCLWHPRIKSYSQVSTLKTL